MADGSFLVLCGIPASGKTTFAKELIRMNWRILGRRVHFLYVSYDDFIPENIPAIETSFLAGWKAKRKGILNEIKELVLTIGINDEHNVAVEKENCFSKRNNTVSESCPCGAGHMTRANDICHVVVIDDNMYYRSMRYEYYQLARRALQKLINNSRGKDKGNPWLMSVFIPVGFGFVEIYLYCSLDVALSRNAARPESVSKDTIIKMSDRIERPEPEKFPWEKLSIMMDTNTSLTQERWKNILELLQAASCNVPPPVKVLNEEEKAKDRATTRTNIIHQADQVIRKHISTKLARMKENVSRQDLKETALYLNQRRRNVMEKLKKDPLEITKNAFVEQFRLSCKTTHSKRRTSPVSITSERLQCELKSQETVDENPQHTANSHAISGVCDSIDLKESHEENCYDFDGSTAAGMETTIILENFWDIVSLEDFSDMVSSFFDQCG